MLEFGEPRFTIPHKSTENLWQDCPRHLEVVEEKKNANANPYELLYAKQLLEFMETSKMIGIYHTHTMETPQARKVRFKKQGRVQTLHCSSRYNFLKSLKEIRRLGILGIWDCNFEGCHIAFRKALLFPNDCNINIVLYIFKVWQNGRLLKMELKNYEHVIVKSALQDTKWENLCFFLQGSIGTERKTATQCFTFAPEIQAKNLLRLEKKTPELFLMGKF
jgi:hypothetical protein